MKWCGTEMKWCGTEIKGCGTEIKWCGTEMKWCGTVHGSPEQTGARVPAACPSHCGPDEDELTRQMAAEAVVSPGRLDLYRVFPPFVWRRLVALLTLCVQFSLHRWKPFADICYRGSHVIRTVSQKAVSVQSLKSVSPRA